MALSRLRGGLKKGRRGRRPRRFTALICVAGLSLLLGKPTLVAAAEEPAAKLERAWSIAGSGDAQQATALAEKAIAVLEGTIGANHPKTILALLDVSRLHVSLGEHDQALEITGEAIHRTEVGGGEGTAFHGVLLSEQGKIATLVGSLIAAERDLETALEILRRELGEADPRTADVLRSLAIVRAERGNLEGARTLFEQAVEVRRRVSEPDRAALAEALLDLAGAEGRLDDTTAALDHIAQAENLLEPGATRLAASAKIERAGLALRESRLGDAEALLREALSSLTEEGTEHLGQIAARAHYSLGLVHLLRGEGRAGEGEFRDALRLFRTALGEEHPAVGRALLGVALFYSQQGQPSLALDLMERSIEILARSAGEDATPQAEARVEYAFLLRDFGQSTRALSELDAAAADLTAGGDAAKLRLAFAQSARGFVLADLGRLDEAAVSFELALAGIRREQGDDSSHLLPGLIALTEVYARLGRIQEAEAMNESARRLIDRDGAYTPRLHGAALAAQAQLEIEAGQTDRAIQTGERLISFMRERLQGPGGACSANLGEQRSARRSFEAVLDVYHRATGRPPKDDLLATMFEAAQFPHLGETAKTSVLTALRMQAEGQDKSTLLRRLQDLAEERCALETLVVGTLGGMGSQSQESPRTTVERLEAISAEVQEIEDQLSAHNAASTTFLDPRPVDFDSAASALERGEALLLQLTGRDGTHLFFLPADGSLDYAHTSLTATELAQHAESLRSATNLAPGKAFSELPDFPVVAANRLYEGIFAPFQKHLPSLSHLFLVPDREMRAVPPGMLLRTLPEKAPDNFDFHGLAELDYLARSVAVTILPAPDTLVMLRSRSASPRKREPFIGIGDPLLGPNLPDPPVEAGPTPGIEAQGRSVQFLRSDGTADPRAFRRMNPLPETRAELTALAEAFGADPGAAIAVGEAASEDWVRGSDALANAQVIAFATHGLVSGEFGELAEPALVLTPPTEPSSVNDGLLTSSEIAGLSLDADWVLLSACNTAAGRHPRAEGLSGLARAFMHAGARSLMVSHWYVPSDAAAALTVFAGRALSADPTRNRAVALRSAMLKVIDGQHPDGRSRPVQAHPLFWAPFVVVGDAV